MADPVRLDLVHGTWRLRVLGSTQAGVDHVTASVRRGLGENPPPEVRPLEPGQRPDVVLCADMAVLKVLARERARAAVLMLDARRGWPGIAADLVRLVLHSRLLNLALTDSYAVTDRLARARTSIPAARYEDDADMVRWLQRAHGYGRRG